MSNVAEIASVASQISARQLAVNAQEAQINVLKQNMEVSAQLQMDMVAMLQEIQPHLGSQINITA